MSRTSRSINELFVSPGYVYAIWLGASCPNTVAMQSLIRHWAYNEVLLETNRVVLRLVHTYLESCCRNEKALEAGPSAVKIGRRKMVLRL